MHVGGFHAVSGLQGLAGASKGLQGRPGAFGGSRDVEGPPKPPKTQQKHRLNEKCARRVPPKPRTLGEAEISCGMVGLD